MIFRVHNDRKRQKEKRRRERERGGEKEKGKKWTSAHLHSSVLICGSGATDGISNWTRETTPGVDRWHRYNGTLEERVLRALWILYPRVHYTPNHSRGVHARIAGNNSYVCLRRGEVSGGFERRTNDKWEHVQRSRIWYREWRVSLHFSLPCCLQFISPSRP